MRCRLLLLMFAVSFTRHKSAAARGVREVIRCSLCQITLTTCFLGGGRGAVVECPTRDRKVPGSIPGGAKKRMHVCKYLLLLSCVLYYIMCLIVVSVCTALSNSAPVWLLTLLCWTTCIVRVYSIIVYCPAWQTLLIVLCSVCLHL